LLPQAAPQQQGQSVATGKGLPREEFGETVKKRAGSEEPSSAG
jgi:hypothetical protein